MDPSWIFLTSTRVCLGRYQAAAAAKSTRQRCSARTDAHAGKIEEDAGCRVEMQRECRNTQYLYMCSRENFLTVTANGAPGSIATVP
jgi:hypothetical protein